jgi:hypothetical protein
LGNPESNPKDEEFITRPSGEERQVLKKRKATLRWGANAHNSSFGRQVPSSSTRKRVRCWGKVVEVERVGISIN